MYLASGESVIPCGVDGISMSATATIFRAFALITIIIGLSAVEL